jgi:hypothetical protein
VPEHDAFGRPVGEDPLASLRGATEPSVEPAPAQPPRPAPAPPVVVRRRRRRGGIVAFLLLAMTLLVAVPVVVVVVAENVRDEVEGLLPDAVETSPPPAGLDADSMIRRGNFADALTALRRIELGRPALLRVAADRIDARLVSGAGRVSQVQVRFDGSVERISTGEPGAAMPTIRFSRIDPGAPQRLVRRGARRADVGANRIDYLVLSTGPGLRWGAYFRGGKIVQGDARGRPRRLV